MYGWCVITLVSCYISSSIESWWLHNELHNTAFISFVSRQSDGWSCVTHPVPGSSLWILQMTHCSNWLECFSGAAVFPSLGRPDVSHSETIHKTCGIVKLTSRQKIQIMNWSNSIISMFLFYIRTDRRLGNWCILPLLSALTSMQHPCLCSDRALMMTLRKALGCSGSLKPVKSVLRFSIECVSVSISSDEDTMSAPNT